MRCDGRLGGDADSDPMTHAAGYLTTKQAAEYLKVSDRLVRREVAAGRLAVYKPLAGTTRFSREDLDAWMAAGRIDATRPRIGETVASMKPIRARRRSSPRT